jgi:hypothetical protein
MLATREGAITGPTAIPQAQPVLEHWPLPAPRAPEAQDPPQQADRIPRPGHHEDMILRGRLEDEAARGVPAHPR